jgi:hypothetical protein
VRACVSPDLKGAHEGGERSVSENRQMVNAINFVFTTFVNGLLTPAAGILSRRRGFGQPAAQTANSELGAP